jgi:hypothetical protein
MTNQEAKSDTRSRLAEAFEQRDAAVADLDRILGAISKTKQAIKSKTAELASLSERLDVVNAAVALGEASADDAIAIEQTLTQAKEEGRRLVGMAKGLVARRDEQGEHVKEAKLVVAREVEATAWPAFHEASRQAVDHFTRFLDAVRQRCQLAATVAGAYQDAGMMLDPLDGSSVSRAKFLGEFNLNGEGLADLIPKSQLKMTQSGLGFLPSGSIQLLTETELLALAEAAEATE